MDENDRLFNFNYFGKVLGILSVCINTFLILMCSRVKPKPLAKDLKLIMAIAFVEYLIPFTTLISRIHYYVVGINLIDIDLGCQILGFIVTCAYYYEIQINVFLALERLCVVSKIKISKYIYLSIHLNGLIFIGLATYSVTQHLMVPSATKLICVHSVLNSIIGPVTYFYLVFSFLLGIAIISYCYYKLAKNILDMDKFVELELNSNLNPSESNRRSKYKKIFIRLNTVLIVYTTCMFGSFLFHLLNGIFHYIYGHVNPVILIMNQLGEFLFFIGIIANSCFFLILHSGIANEVKKSYNRIKFW
ncbi:hypothetical protein K502DRAFT_350209 [Neoconidiobolus thromboides FSU 785]|nr:hypothetical protein K502DRAFT_350209 [Neoconidiobolus thromboides FSU 785]